MISADPGARAVDDNRTKDFHCLWKSQRDIAEELLRSLSHNNLNQVGSDMPFPRQPKCFQNCHDWVSVSLMKQKGNFSNISQNYQSCHAKIQFFQLKKTICPIPQKFLQYLTGSLQMKWTRGSRKKMVLNKIISYLKKEGRKEKLKVIYIFTKGWFCIRRSFFVTWSSEAKNE